MFVRDLTGAHPRDLIVQVDDPDSSVADLAEALVPDRPPGPLLIDGREVSPAAPLDRSGVGNGSVVELPPAPDELDEPRPRPVATLTVTAGPDSGRRFGLAAGTHRLGRSGADADIDLVDPTVSADQARVTVDDAGAITVADSGGRNPTVVASRYAAGATPVPAGVSVRCGASRFVITPGPPAPGEPDVSTARSGPPPRPLHRTGRPMPAEEDPAFISPPVVPDSPPTVTPVGVVGVVASLAVGGVMVLVLGSWMYGLFALLGPVLMVAAAIDSRWRRKRAGRVGARRRRLELAAFERALAERRSVARAQRWRRVTGPGEARAILDHLGAGGAATGCWERRPGDPDAFTVRVGVGPVPWDPPVAGDRDEVPPDVADVLTRYRSLPDVPIAVALEAGAPLAVVGGGEVARGVVRSVVVQAAVSHGPADLQVAVMVGDAQAAAWDWCCWLPHAVAPDVGPLVAAGPRRVDELADRLVDLRPEPDGGVRRLVVIDDPEGLAALRGGVRTVLRAASDPRAGLVPLVIVTRRDQVPAVCSTVLEVDDDGTLRTSSPLTRGPSCVVATSTSVAAEMARELARHDDPEVDDPGRGLPDRVPLVSLLGVDHLGPTGIAARWSAGGTDPAPTAVLGTTADGPLLIDLAADGPHVLVAGTTGSGKSELLRTLVLSLATRSSPRHLTFVLIDFKGGSAFDACASLPHTCGSVTDLDEHLAARALRCLEAELRHRERRLRQVGADDLGHMRRLDPDGEPLPRLVVVVDEFATLAGELPDFVDALVGVAQRGRSLGVHLVLATQRPSGAVSERIRANVGLRIALRVQSGSDSVDVIDDEAAALLPRGRPGRALVRLGPGELVPAQTALATSGTLGRQQLDTAHRRISTRPLTVRHLAEDGLTPEVAGGPTGPSDLRMMVDAMGSAWRDVGGRPPRRPWPEPLPSEIAWPVEPRSEPSTSRLVLGLADEPDLQRQCPFGWSPEDGPLLIVGLPGSGTTTALATVALEGARRFGPADLHLHVLDLGAGELTALAGLPHVGAVVGSADRERQRRLIADLFDDLQRRMADPTTRSRPRLLIVDGVGALRAAWDEVEPSGTWERFLTVVARGTEVGVHVAMAADGPASVPHQVIGACIQRMIFRLAEPADHAVFGIPAAAVPRLVPGRAMWADGPTVVQVARPTDGTASAVARLAGTVGSVTADVGPAPVGRLPDRCRLRDLSVEVAVASDGELIVPIGRSDVSLAVARLRLPPGGHALVAGPPRSGRTTTLRSVAAVVSTDGAIRVAVIARNRAGWPAAVEVTDPSSVGVEAILAHDGPLLVLVDDADLIPDDHPLIAPAVGERRADRHFVVSARSDRARSMFGHWLREVRADRAGLLLDPDLDVDGDLIGTRLPRRLSLPMVPGRGWLSGGEPEGVVQVATPDPSVATIARCEDHR